MSKTNKKLYYALNIFEFTITIINNSYNFCGLNSFNWQFTKDISLNKCFNNKM